MNNTLPPIHLLHCLVCQKRLFLLAQLNAPLIDTHRRILYLLACSNAACYSSLKAIRCISAQLNQPIHQLIPSSSIESDIQKGLCKSFFKESLPLEDQFGGLKIDMNELSLLMANRFKKTAASTIRTTASPTKPNITAPTIIANATTSTATATNDTNTTFHEIKKKNVKKASINAHDNSLQPSNTRLDNIEKNQIQDYIPCYEIAFEVDMPMNNLDSDDEFDRPLTKDQLEHTHQLLMDYQMESNCQIVTSVKYDRIDTCMDVNSGTKGHLDPYSNRCKDDKKSKSRSSGFDLNQSDHDEHYENYTPKYYTSELSHFQAIIEADPHQLVRYGNKPVLFEKMKRVQCSEGRNQGNGISNGCSVAIGSDIEGNIGSSTRSSSIEGGCTIGSSNIEGSCTIGSSTIHRKNVSRDIQESENDCSRCSTCNRELRFEMQLMPHILDFMKNIEYQHECENTREKTSAVVNDCSYVKTMTKEKLTTTTSGSSSRLDLLCLSDSSIDFATVLVFKCDWCLNDSDLETRVVYREEHVIMQRDTLF